MIDHDRQQTAPQRAAAPAPLVRAARAGGVALRRVLSAGPLTRREALLAGLALSLLALAVYGPHVIRGGWYYDDWIIVAQLRDGAADGVAGVYEAARSISYRPGYAVVLTALYGIGGTGQSSYLAVGVALTALQGFLFYLLLRRMGFGRGPGGVAAALLVVLPAVDAVRLWTAAFPAGVALTLVLGGVLAALRGLAAPGRRAQVSWHAVAAALYFAAILTYEGGAGLVLVAGILYAIRAGVRPALPRAVADWVAFGLAMAIMAPRASDTRPAQTSVDYLLDRVGEMWPPARDVFRGMLPFPDLLGGPVGLALLFGGVVGAGLALGAGGPARRAVLPWLTMAVVGVVFALAGLVVLLPAESYFVPRSTGIGNRTGLFAAPGAVVLLMSVLVLVPLGLATLAGRWRLAAWVAVPLVVGTAIDLGVREHRQQDPWAQAWREEQRVVAAVKAAIGPRLPAGAAVVTFRHTTQLLPADVPVFSATWDLRGALWQAYRRPWMSAQPWIGDVACGRHGLATGGQEEPAYAYGKLIFVDVAGRAAERIRSQAGCQAAVARLTS